jgi:hypothetical protein
MKERNAFAPRCVPPRVEPLTPVGDRITVRGRLALLGWPSIHSWARAHGYEGQMASYCVGVWGNRTDKHPHGGISRAVMRDLRATLAEGRRPDHEQHAGSQDG